MSVSFRIRQNGQTVATVTGLQSVEAEAEIMHYARQYRADGELTIEHNAAGHWKRFVYMCQWTVPARSNRGEEDNG